MAEHTISLARINTGNHRGWIHRALANKPSQTFYVWVVQIDNIIYIYISTYEHLGLSIYKLDVRIVLRPCIHWGCYEDASFTIIISRHEVRTNEIGVNIWQKHLTTLPLMGDDFANMSSVEACKLQYASWQIEKRWRHATRSMLQTTLKNLEENKISQERCKSLVREPSVRISVSPTRCE